jgi:hypothetical protein
MELPEFFGLPKRFANLLAVLTQPDRAGQENSAASAFNGQPQPVNHKIQIVFNHFSMHFQNHAHGLNLYRRADA